VVDVQRLQTHVSSQITRDGGHIIRSVRSDSMSRDASKRDGNWSREMPV
jgi:hypothetical protein